MNINQADYILEPFNAGKGVVMNRQHVLNALDFNGIDQFSGLAKVCRSRNHKINEN